MSRITWHGDEFLRAAQRAAEDGVYAGAAIAADAATRSFGTRHGGVPSLPGGPPNVQTGHLRNSVTFVHAKDLGEPLTARYGTNVKYGRYLEFGANPKGRPYLTVPLNDKAKKASRRGIPTRSLGLNIIRTKKAVFLGKRIPGKHARVELWFILKREVKIAPRPWLLPSMINNRAAIMRVSNEVFSRKLSQYYGRKG